MTRKNRFRENKDRRRQCDTVLSILSKMKRGDILSHEIVEGAIGLARLTSEYYQLVRKVEKRLLKERGISFLQILNVGYKLATVAEQAKEVPNRRIRRANGQLRRAERSIEAINEPHALSSLSEHEAHLMRVRLQSIKAAKIKEEREMRTEGLLRRRGDEDSGTRE